MLQPDDQAYYLRRAEEEMDRGDQAIGPAIAALHYELSYRYSLLASRSDNGTPQLRLVDPHPITRRAPAESVGRPPREMWNEGITVGSV